MRRILGVLLLAALATFSVTTALAQPIVGTWATSMRTGSPNDTYTVMRLSPDGRISTQTTNISPSQGSPSEGTRGMGFQMFGVYSFDPRTGAFRYRWTDYAPRQTCLGGNCARLGPALPLGREVVNRLRFLGPNEFVATLPDGSASTTYTRAR